jgi:pyoverdine/dityrosine biosynthesis protein Dit1
MWLHLLGLKPDIKFQHLTHFLYHCQPDRPAMLMNTPIVTSPIQTAMEQEKFVQFRRGLMAAGGIDRGGLRRLIHERCQQTLVLYSGLSRFLLDDLSENPQLVGKSTSQQKQLAAKVAEEVIVRNQALSNVISMLYPHHIRLSVHAHSNIGPKFGIRLFSKDNVRPIKSIQQLNQPFPVGEFHLPTPWHNAIIQVDDDPKLYLGKANVAKEAIASGEYEGEWVEERGGGYFSLRRKLNPKGRGEPVPIGGL